MIITFFDLETTGVSVTKDRIVQISAIKVDEKYNLIAESKKNFLINPTIPIPKGASDVHGISDEMVKDKPTFKAYSEGMFQYFSNTAVAGYNIRGYDVPLLSEEFGRVGIAWPPPDIKMIDAFSIFKQKEKRDLSSALKFYAGEEMTGAHDAENDNLATIKILQGQIAMYPEIAAMDLNQLHDFCIAGKKTLDLAGKIGINEQGQAIYAFGKDIGKTVKENPGFAQWMLKNDFPKETKNIITQLLSTKN